MKYDTKLADRIREALEHLPDVEEKEMFSGVCFMVSGKMCVCISGEEMMCRIGASQMENALTHNNCRQMMMRGKPAKDFILIGLEGFQHQYDFDHWIKLALKFNPEARSSKER